MYKDRQTSSNAKNIEKQLLVFCSSQQTRQGFERELLVHHPNYGSEINFEREVSSKETCFYSYFYCDI